MAEDYWKLAIQKIKAERTRAEKIARHKRLIRQAIKRERELAAIRSLMRRS
jgi:hypothetical protein